MDNVSTRALRQSVENDIGGALVIFPFTISDGDGVRKARPGEKLTEEQVRAMPRANLKALKASGKLHVIGKAESERASPAQIFVVHRGSGKYDVIEGVKINDEPITKEQAEALSGVEAQPN